MTSTAEASRARSSSQPPFAPPDHPRRAIFQTARSALLFALLAISTGIPTFVQADSPATDPPLEILLADAWARLPPRVRETLVDSATRRPLVAITLDREARPIPEPEHYCQAASHSRGVQLARFEPSLFSRGGRIVVNASLASRYSAEALHDEPIRCRHGTLHREAVAAVLHELAHAYEREAQRRGTPTDIPRPSSDEQYQRIAEFSPGWLYPTSKNTHPSRSPDLYELRSVRESFAVNFEYFLLDSAFACRRPSQFSYFSRAFDFDPFPERRCQVNTEVQVITRDGPQWRSLDPSRLYRVDYLLATKGTTFASRWGHSMLRLVLCAPARSDGASGMTIPATPVGPACEEDGDHHLVVSYRADLRGIEPGLSSLLLERYPSRLFLVTFDEIFREYLHGQLRDLAAYPIDLDAEQKTSLIHRILESHWGYEGDYHFVGGNCATETRDLLASVRQPLRPPVLQALSPIGVRENWTAEGWIDTLPSRTYSSLLPVLGRIWNDRNILDGVAVTKGTRAQAKLLAYMRNSEATERWKTFQKKLPKAPDKPTAVRDFIVMEAQILRMLEQKLTDELFTLAKRKTPVLLEDLSSRMRARFETAHPGAYGIPLRGEIPGDSVGQDFREHLGKSMAAMRKALEKDLAGRISQVEGARNNLHGAFALQGSIGDARESSGEFAQSLVGGSE